ncbi:BRO family protein [Microbacterium aurantiacum]|uniref:BRO family protein n=1 Tax=Microbacterium aurantiacum TaxID=162393 RepID=UPI001CA5750E|nr:BRO family protein [Microbacterium aurantiacum]
MSALEVFDFEGVVVRTVVIDGEPWFVAVDVAMVLGYSATSAMTRTLDEDEKGVRNLHTPGGVQESTIISEAGLFSAILRSRVPGVRAFKRWITHEVLPSIRRSGAYVVPESREQLLARAVTAANELISEAHQQIEVLTPKAEAWDELASAEGDYAVADAAALLTRAGISTGRDRLFASLAEIRWIYRGEKRRWRPYASTLDSGYMAERAQPPHRDADGELVPSPPQVRITARGLERLRVRLGSGSLSH